MAEKLKKFIQTKNPISKNSIAVKLEATISEKLERKRTVADKLNEKQEIIRSRFQDKTESVRQIKERFKRKEEELLYSVQLIETYMREIQSLKYKAEDMYEALDLENQELNLDFYKLERERSNIYDRKSKSVKLVERYRCFKDHMERIVSELPRYQSTKELVEYYLVLNMLRGDLQEDKKKQQVEEKNVEIERKKLSDEVKSYPLKLLEKENAVYNLSAKIQDIHDESNELEQELDDILSENVKDDVEWNDTEKWIVNLHEMVCQRIPFQSDDVKETDSILSKLKKIKELASMATEALNRLKQKNDK